jgi:hypothetical protein
MFTKLTQDILHSNLAVEFHSEHLSQSPNLRCEVAVTKQNQEQRRNPMKVQKQLTGLPLLRFGFVHVTNLPYRQSSQDTEERFIRARTGENGRHDSNNGMKVAITLDGEVWLRAYPQNWQYQGLEQVLASLCPKVGDAFVPCSNGETIASYYLFYRVADPYWSDGRKVSCEPQGLTRLQTEVETIDRTPATAVLQ